jgi:hypothetical protein
MCINRQNPNIWAPTAHWTSFSADMWNAAERKLRQPRYKMFPTENQDNK